MYVPLKSCCGVPNRIYGVDTGGYRAVRMHWAHLFDGTRHSGLGLVDYGMLLQTTMERGSSQ